MFTKEEFTKAFVERLEKEGVGVKSGTLSDTIPDLVNDLDKDNMIDYSKPLEQQVNENAEMFLVALMLRGIGG